RDREPESRGEPEIEMLTRKGDDYVVRALQPPRRPHTAGALLLYSPTQKANTDARSPWHVVLLLYFHRSRLSDYSGAKAREKCWSWCSPPLSLRERWADCAHRFHLGAQAQ
ncbi:hypothetical protein KUCAC02_002565, partial [Chaenocephalus aceratus]